MAIKIIDKEPDIYLTRAEHDRLYAEYKKCCMHMVNPPSFEEYVRSGKNETNR